MVVGCSGSGGGGHGDVRGMYSEHTLPSLVFRPKVCHRRLMPCDGATSPRT